MNKNDCQNERLSTRTVGTLISIASLPLLAIGLIVLPPVGFVFAIPFLVLGIGMVAAPESKTCQLIMGGLRGK